MDYKVALVVLSAAVALSSAAPRTIIVHRDYFASPTASNGFGNFAFGNSAPSPSPAAAGRSATSGVASTGAATGTTSGGFGSTGSAFGRGGFDPLLLSLYNEDFEFDNEDFRLFGGARGLYDLDLEDRFFPFFS